MYEEIVSYIKVNPQTIISPISSMAGKKIRGRYGSNFVFDGEDRTYMMSQIYFGQMKTFVGIYACAYKNNAVCTMTKQGFRTTPTLSACFARLFEDCSFITAGYDNSFHMVSYKGLYRQTGKVKSVARQVLNVSDLDPADVENLNEALESCVIYHRGEGNELSDFWLRWGNHIEHLKAQLVCTDNNKKDPYAYHKGCFATYKAYELDNYDSEPESSGSSDNESMDSDESMEAVSLEDVAPDWSNKLGLSYYECGFLT
jgi:hypothetical protein